MATGLAAVALVWLGYRAVVQWKQAAAMVAWERAGAAADLLVAALTRDMRGGQLQVLASADRDRITSASDVELLHPIERALAR
jgi:hypothetical protein